MVCLSGIYSPGGEIYFAQFLPDMFGTKRRWNAPEFVQIMQMSLDVLKM